MLALPTVGPVPATSSIHHARRVETTRRRLGKAGAPAGTGMAAGAPALRLVSPKAPPRPLTFPLGARTRRVDASGRIKFTGDAAVAAQLGWQSGALEATLVDGWLVLRQPSHVASLTAGRYSTMAAFSSSPGGVERVALKPAQLDTLDLPGDRHLLVAAVPDAGALVVVNPVACLAAAPGAVAAVLGAAEPPDTDQQPEESP